MFPSRPAAMIEQGITFGDGLPGVLLAPPGDAGLSRRKRAVSPSRSFSVLQRDRVGVIEEVPRSNAPAALALVAPTDDPARPLRGDPGHCSLLGVCAP